MKIYIRILFILSAVMLGLEMGKADGAVQKPEILTDSALASIHGGFCPFEECEPSATGVCQPIPPDLADVCAATKCVYVQEDWGRVVSYWCELFGDDTCTEPEIYRQCVWAFKLSYCSYGSVPVCGALIQADCLPEIEEKYCRCTMTEPGPLCVWTNCNP